MALLREPNRHNISFPNGLPPEVEAGLVAMNSVAAIKTEDVGLSPISWQLQKIVPSLFQEQVDRLMFDWLNDKRSVEELQHRRYGLTSESERLDWLAKSNLLAEYNDYVHGTDGIIRQPLDEAILETLKPKDGKYPIVLEETKDIESPFPDRDDSRLVVVNGPTHFGFSIDPNQFGQFVMQKTDKILPFIYSDAGFSWAGIDADLYDSYSAITAYNGYAGSVRPTSLIGKTVLAPNGSTYKATSISQAISLSLALPKGFTVEFDASSKTTKTDALIRRAADIILHPAEFDNRERMLGNVWSSTVALRGIHSLFSGKGNWTQEYRGYGTLTDFVADELVRSRFFPKGPRDNQANFKRYAEIATLVADDLGVTPMQIMEAIHKAAPR